MPVDGVPVLPVRSRRHFPDDAPVEVLRRRDPPYSQQELVPLDERFFGRLRQLDHVPRELRVLPRQTPLASC